MDALREFFVKLGLDTDAASFAQAQAAVDGLEFGLKAVVSAAQAAGQALVDAVGAASGWADHLDDVSQRTGISAEALQGLGYAAELSGSSMEEVQQGVQHLARVMADAAGGSHEARKALAALGVKATDSAGNLRDPADALADVADGAAAMTNDTQRSAAVLDVLGRGASGLIPMLRGGSKGLAEARAEAEALGIVMSDADVAMGGAFADNLSRVTGFANGLQRSFGLLATKFLAPLVDKFLEWAKANRAVIQTKIEEFFRGVALAAEFVGRAFTSLLGLTSWLIDNWKFVAMAIAALTLAVGVFAGTALVAAAEVAIGWMVAAAPVLLMAAGFLAVGLAIDEVLTAMRGGKTVMGEWTKYLDDWTKPNAEDPWWLAAIKKLQWYLSDVTRIVKAMEDTWLFKTHAATLKAFGFDINAPDTADTPELRAQLEAAHARRQAEAVARLSPTPTIPADNTWGNWTSANTANNTITVNVASVDMVRPAVAGAVGGAGDRTAAEKSDALANAGRNRR